MIYTILNRRSGCPICGEFGKRVELFTVRSLVKEDLILDIQNDDHFFCADPNCEVVYFTMARTVITKDHLKTRVGLKEREAPRPVCYCFGYTIEAILDEIREKGRSTAEEVISDKIQAGLCHCEDVNPEGRCCLGNVNIAVREAQEEFHAFVQMTARAKLMSSYYCSMYSACSVDRDLRGAIHAELEEYKKAKAFDGKTFTGRMSPNFEAVSTNGQKISLSQFRGKPVAIVFLAVHCNHSQDTLPILSSLKKEYEPQGPSILPVYVHSGTVEDIKQFAESAKVDFPLLFVTKEVSNRFANRMVPTTFLIDKTGHIVRQFVGFKKQAVLEEAFSTLILEHQMEHGQVAPGR